MEAKRDGGQIETYGCVNEEYLVTLNSLRLYVGIAGVAVFLLRLLVIGLKAVCLIFGLFAFRSLTPRARSRVNSGSFAARSSTHFRHCHVPWALRPPVTPFCFIQSFFILTLLAKGVVVAVSVDLFAPEAPKEVLEVTFLMPFALGSLGFFFLLASVYLPRSSRCPLLLTQS